NTLFSGTNLTYKLLDNNLIVVLSAIKEENKDIRITGRITGESGEALARVSILEKGTQNGTTTDNNGTFTLTVGNDATLVISSIGYETQEIKVGGRSVVDIKLVPATKKIDEVVVIGYGSASKRDLTGSITKVSGKDIQDKPNTNPVASLQGRVAGLSIVNNGTPGAAPDIRIRGTASLGQVHPLYVVDGIFNDNIDYLNPNDIESIEVLKDPSSLAIFGVRGATGVIAITTKKAKAGQTVVNFNTAYGSKKLVNKIAFVNGDDFKMLFAEERANDGITAAFDYTGQTANTDWIDAVTRKGQFSTSNLSISGSTEKNKFNFGMGYTYDEGIIKHQQLDKIQLSFNDEFKISKAIRIGFNFNGTRQHNPYDATGALDDARKVVPLISDGTKSFRVRNLYGLQSDTINMNLYSGLNTSLQSAGVVNPLLRLENEWDKVKNYEYRTVGSIFGEVNFLKYFSLRSTVYADISNVNKRQYTPTYYAYNPVTNTPYIYNSVTAVSENDDTYRKFQQDHVLTFRKGFGGHNVTAMGGFTTYYFSYFGRTGNVSQVTTGLNPQPIPNDSRFWYINNYFQDPQSTKAGSSQYEKTTASLLGRLLYNYKGKYFLNASIRDDASSQMPEASRHQMFWALGGAWEITKEDFMQQQHVVDFLKLKASVGVLGNQSAVDGSGNTLNNPFYPVLNTGSNAVFGTNVYTAASQRYQANPDLKWETVSAQEVGVEVDAFNRRLHFEANYFNKVTNDLMTYVTRSEIGLDPILINGGSLRNRGQEFSATWNQTVTKDLNVTVGGNITFLKNKIIKLADDIPTGIIVRGFQNNGSAESRTSPGNPIGSFFGYIVEGIFQTDRDVLLSPDQGSLGAYGKGDFKFKDINGDGVINSSDRTIIGNPTPDFTYGASVNVNYKNFTLGVDVGGVYGNEVFRTWGSLESPFQRVNYSSEKLNRWHGEGTSNWVPIISQGHRINYNGSTYNIEDGSYFRIRNIQLSYSFQQTLISKVKMKNLRVFVNVQNPKTWKNNLGYTAEFGGDATAFGYDNAGGAIPAVTTVGLNVTF
ncbi:MAG: SusC/RagA family TonB-linked outer membrane protein, partial [Ferruginibacter sp.]